MALRESRSSTEGKPKLLAKAPLSHEEKTLWAPLNPAKREIRLARLAPRERLGAQAECSLEVVSLDENPQFEALSYTWGDPNITEPISLQGIQWPVTVNLEAALRYLRDASVEKVLWIDAICIDQSSIEERNSQVLLMSHIYRNATLVHVWLGEAAKGSEGAIEFIETVSQGTPLKDVRIRGKPLNGEHLLNLTDLLTRPWWKRVWVQQEFALAREATLHCGRSYLSQESLIRAYENMENVLEGWHRSELFTEMYKIRSSLEGLNRSSYMKQSCKEPSTTTLTMFLSIIGLGRFYTSSDPRDAVYGFLGLTNDKIASRFKPNYHDSPLQVFRDTTIETILGLRSLLPFGLAGLANKSRDQFPRPTWMLDLSKVAQEDSEEVTWAATVDRLTDTKIFSACGDAPLVFNALDDSTAQCNGFYIDRIEDKSADVLNFENPQMYRKEILENLDAWQHLCNTHSSYNIPEEELFWRVLSNDIYHSLDDGMRRCISEDIEAYHTWMNTRKTPDVTFNKNQTAYDFHTSAWNACTGRRLFATTKGYIGTGPAELEVGDHVYILAGGPRPYVLRPVEDAERPCTFQLVGDSYVHGLMDGEAVAHLITDASHNDKEREDGCHDVFLI